MVQVARRVVRHARSPAKVCIDCQDARPLAATWVGRVASVHVGDARWPCARCRGFGGFGLLFRRCGAAGSYLLCCGFGRGLCRGLVGGFGCSLGFCRVMITLNLQLDKLNGPRTGSTHAML